MQKVGQIYYTDMGIYYKIVKITKSKMFFDVLSPDGELDVDVCASRDFPKNWMLVDKVPPKVIPEEQTLQVYINVWSLNEIFEQGFTENVRLSTRKENESDVSLCKLSKSAPKKVLNFNWETGVYE